VDPPVPKEPPPAEEARDEPPPKEGNLKNENRGRLNLIEGNLNKGRRDTDDLVITLLSCFFSSLLADSWLSPPEVITIAFFSLEGSRLTVLIMDGFSVTTFFDDSFLKKENIEENMKKKLGFSPESLDFRGVPEKRSFIARKLRPAYFFFSTGFEFRSLIGLLTRKDVPLYFF